VTPLSTIPQVYFDENFHLENPRTFDVVSEKSEVVRTPLTPSDEANAANGSANGSALPPRKALATNAILQEKLSWYLDTVEIRLISSISAASKSFFAALGSLKELHSEAADSVTKIKKLREDLAQLDRDMAVGGLEIIGMKQRRENLRKLNDSVDQLKNVVEGASHCEELVERGDLETALDHISTLEEYTCGRFKPRSEDTSWLTTNPHLQLRDLRRLKALSGFAEGMDQLRARVGKGYENRFLDALLTDLRHHIASVPIQDTAKRWAHASLRARGHASGPSVVPAYLQTNSQLRQNLSVILHGLSRSKSLTIASAAFRDAIMREMKALIRQHLPSSSDDDAESMASISTTRSRAVTQQDKSARLARNLRNLGPDDAEELLMKMYCGVGEALRRLQTQVKMLLDVTSAQALSPTSTGPRSPPRTPNMGSIDALSPPQVRTRPRSDSTPLQEELMQALDMSSLLGQAVDAAQTQVTKILKVRAEQSSTLSLTHFLRYFVLNRLFADECEAVSGRSGASLKNVVNAHITEFIAIMARNERDELERIMDNDQWTAKDFPQADEAVLAQVLQGMSSDPPKWIAQGYVWEDNTTPRLNGTPQTNGSSTPSTTASKEQVKAATIVEEKFVLVTSTMALLHGITRYQILVACIPSIGSDVSRELVEYLRFFNSRSCQLVLGAGATRSSAALPNINTKHLALASQSLSFVIALTPYIREYIRRRPGMSPEKLGEYDKVKRLYQDHQVSINEKLLDIMSGRAARHTKTMAAVDFDAEDAGEGVSKHMETMAKETVVLHRTLGRYLPEHHVRGIMLPVFANFREQWGDAFRGAAVATQRGKDRYVRSCTMRQSAGNGYANINAQLRLLRDAEFFETKLGKFDGAADTGSYLIGLARDKNVAAPPAPAPASAPEPAPTAAPALPTRPSNENVSATKKDDEKPAQMDENGDGRKADEESAPTAAEADDEKTGSAGS
jgi:vacuolar protein sorting-associated protein 54